LTVSLIWAQSANGVIGNAGALPWHLPEDLASFRRWTSGHAVLMGRRTWESLPERFRPLPGRRNVVLTRSPDYPSPGAERFPSLVAALDALDEDVWVIGGATVYAEAIPLAQRLVRTEIDAAYDGDTFAPALDGSWEVVGREPTDGWLTSSTGLRYAVTTLQRR
jgi:dihydrofolate reductase